MVRNKKMIQQETDIEVGCAGKGIIHQIEEEKLSFNNVSEGTNKVNIFHNMHPSLLNGGTFVKEEICTLVFGRKNAHVVKGRTGELVKEIMKQAEEKNSDDIFMTVPFNKKTLP